MMNSGTARSTRSQAGFTLLEVIVAVTLVVMMAVAIWGVFRISIRSWSRGAELIDANQRHRSILNMVRKQLASAYGMVRPIEQPQAGMPLGNTSLIFSGTENSLIFLSPSSLRFQDSPGLTLVSYEVSQDDRGNYYFEIQPIKTDELLRFSDSLADEILSEIDRFWELKKQFEINKFSHRRGYLLYGPQGSGKSIIVQQIIEGIVNRGGIAIWVDKNPKMITTAIVEALRIVEPTRPIVVIFEDIDAIIQDYGESAILSYLDGDGRIDGVLNLATTNYPEKLDKRVVARPRRFDRVVKVDVPSPSIRKEYFKYKVKDLTEEQLEQWTTSTAGFSFAALADLIISVKCFEYKFEDAVERLRKLLDSNPSSEEFKTRKTGFNAH